MRAPLPANEPDRLTALASYGIVDSPPELSFDRITRTARKVFNTPVCLITLVDAERQFFKSKIGLDINETPRDQAFCAHALVHDECMVVADALLDPRFADNPLVTGAPHIRFYTGAPLRTSGGFNLGTLCVIDFSARDYPSADQISTLEDLAAQVVELLEARKTLSEVEHLKAAQIDDRRLWRRREQTAALALDAGKMAFWEFDALREQAQWSERMFDIMGFPAEGDPPSIESWLGRIHPDDRPSLLAQVEQIRQSGGPFTMKYRILHPKTGERWITMMGDHFVDDYGVVGGSLGVTWDSTEADCNEQALAQSEALFRSLSAASPVGIICTDLDGKARYVNRRMAEIWETPIEEFSGTNWLSRVHPQDLDGLLQVRRANSAKASR